MSELAKRFPELYAKLHPEDRFQAYFKAAKEFWSVAAQLPPQERWQRLMDLSESKEAKAWIAYQGKVCSDIFSSGNEEEIRELSDYLAAQAENSRNIASLFPAEEAPPVSYPKEIAGYVLQTIGLYCDALSPQKLQAIRLRFDGAPLLEAGEAEKTDPGDIQPVIGLSFEREEHQVRVGMLWDVSVALERDGRKNAQIWAESVWPEYLQEVKPSLSQFRQDAEDVRRLVEKEYPSVPVALEIR